MSDEAKKVYMVKVEIHLYLPVVASSEDEAEEIAGDTYEEDLRDGNEHDVYFYVSKVTKMQKDLEKVIPYGEKDQTRRDWTVEQWLQLEAERPKKVE